MARETKAERLARMAQELEAQREAERQAYPARLMKTLERLNNQYNMNLKVVEGFFVVECMNSRYTNDYTLSYSYTHDSQAVLEELEWALDALEEAQAEARRRDEVKREAERKVREMLSDEERELLGL